MDDAIFTLAMLKRKMAALAEDENTRYKSYCPDEILRMIAALEAFTVLGEEEETE